MKTGQYAFWKYDLYPYLGGAEIMTVFPDKSFDLKGYGLCSFDSGFKPLSILDAKAGKWLIKELKYLGEWHRKSLDNLNKEFSDRAKRSIDDARRNRFESY
jgi:hypothetical protein